MMTHENSLKDLGALNCVAFEASRTAEGNSIRAQPCSELDGDEEIDEAHEALRIIEELGQLQLEEEPEVLSGADTLSKDGWGFLHNILKIGGQRAAMVLAFVPVLVAFRTVLLPLLAFGSNTVAVVLSIAVGVFLIFCGLCVLVSVIKN